MDITQNKGTSFFLTRSSFMRFHTQIKASTNHVALHQSQVTTHGNSRPVDCLYLSSLSPRTGSWDEPGEYKVSYVTYLQSSLIIFFCLISTVYNKGSIRNLGQTVYKYIHIRSQLFLQYLCVTPENIKVHIRSIKVLHLLLSVTTIWFIPIGPDDVLMMQGDSCETGPIKELPVSQYSITTCLQFSVR